MVTTPLKSFDLERRNDDKWLYSYTFFARDIRHALDVAARNEADVDPDTWRVKTHSTKAKVEEFYTERRALREFLKYSQVLNGTRVDHSRLTGDYHLFAQAHVYDRPDGTIDAIRKAIDDLIKVISSKVKKFPKYAKMQGNIGSGAWCLVVNGPIDFRITITYNIHLPVSNGVSSGYQVVVDAFVQE